MAEKMRAEDADRTKQLEALRRQLDDIPEGDVEARRATEEEIAMVALETQAWRMFASEQLDIEASLRLRDLDRSIKGAVAQFAQINGYDIVLVDDSGRELSIDAQSKASREMQVKAQMNARRLLYTNPEVDVTDELIERMNNAFNAGS
jgi:Skp family chaperone for outer membrane proteins